MLSGTVARVELMEPSSEVASGAVEKVATVDAGPVDVPSGTVTSVAPKKPSAGLI